MNMTASEQEEHDDKVTHGTIDCVIVDVSAATMSFRKPRYENYQATYNLPPKTMVAGFVACALGEGEKFYYRLLKDFKYSVIMKNIQGKFIDLWRAVQGKGVPGGEKGIFFREKLYQPTFRIYLSSNVYLEEIKRALNRPKNIVYLGLSEDLVVFQRPIVENLVSFETDEVDSMIPYELSNKIAEIKWLPKTKILKQYFPPTQETMVEDFKVDFSGAWRERRNPLGSIEVMVVPGGRFKLKEKIRAFKGIDDDVIILL